MSRLVRTWLLIVAGLTGLLVAAVATLLTSPWFTWQLLPAETPLRAVVAESLVPGLPSSNNIFVGSPWDRLRANVSHPNRWAAGRSAAVTLLRDPVPLWPAAIIEYAPDGTREPAEPAAVIVTSDEMTVRALILTTGTDSPAQALAQQATAPPLPPLPPLLTGSEIIVPSHVLTGLPQPLHDAWNEELRTRLGLLNTTPDIVSYLSQFDTTAISISSDRTVLGIQGAADTFMSTVTTWLTEDERRGRPARRAFRLPDGTIGYEQIPGEPSVLFTATADGCQSPIPGKSSLWLCQHANRAVVASSEAHARAALEQPTDLWRVQLSPDVTGALQASPFCTEATDPLTKTLCRVHTVTAAGSGDRTAARITILE